jgi:competence ComEA-like helix-hairpin-helix protein
MKWLKEYFDLTRSEAYGVLIAAGLIIFIFCTRYFFLLMPSAPSLSKSKMDSLLKDAKISQVDSGNLQPTLAYQDERLENRPVNNFYFDPNTAGEDQLLDLGLSPKVVKSIVHYRDKGGYFKNPQDFGKIYNLSKTDFQRLHNYIRIKHNKHEYAEKKYEHSYPDENSIEKIDINSADSLSLLNVKGIGPAFASRILKYRRQLGGFYSINQLHEVFGIDSGRFLSIAPQLSLTGSTVKININTATLEQLKAHPYIRWKNANAIINYRKQHGAFVSTQELQQIISIKKEDVERMLPYLTI